MIPEVFSEVKVERKKRKREPLKNKADQTTADRRLISSKDNEVLTIHLVIPVINPRIVVKNVRHCSCSVSRGKEIMEKRPSIREYLRL